MGARFKENLVEVTDDCHAFFERTGTLRYYEDVEALGFETFDVIGHFMGSRAEELVGFCTDQPNYHIVTVTRSGYYENRYVPGQSLYYLANGDSNPNLVLNIFLHKHPELFAEEGLAKALAIIAQVDGGDEPE